MKNRKIPTVWMTAENRISDLWTTKVMKNKENRMENKGFDKFDFRNVLIIGGKKALLLV